MSRLISIREAKSALPIRIKEHQDAMRLDATTGLLLLNMPAWMVAHRIDWEPILIVYILHVANGLRRLSSTGLSTAGLRLNRDSGLQSSEYWNWVPLMTSSRR